MSIASQIDTDIKQAMMQKDTARVSVLRMLKSALHNKAIELRTDKLDDEQELKVLKSEAKKRSDAATAYQSGGRSELAAKEQQERTIIERYLPAQLDDAALTALVDEAMTELGESAQFGLVMKTVMAKAAGQADGQKVSAIVKEKMGG